MKYDGYHVVQVSEDGIAQVKNSKGDLREVALIVNRDLETNELTIGAARHGGKLKFEGSKLWTINERVGQEA